MKKEDITSKAAFAAEKRESFEQAARPLIEWLATNIHPHAKAIVDSTSAELLEGSMSYLTEEFLVD